MVTLARTTTGPSTSDALTLMRQAFTSTEVNARYRALVHPTPMATGCLVWTGAIAGRGHGRFWLGRKPAGHNVAVIAHRWSWALAHGLEDLTNATVIRHRCDNSVCRTSNTWSSATPAKTRSKASLAVPSSATPCVTPEAR